jgi:predicted RNA-binding protein YlqC (UPF0109 family)
MASERDEALVDREIDTESLDSGEAGVDELDAADVSQPEASEEAVESLRELVTYLVQNLVDEPDEAEITLERRGPSVHIQLRLPEGDLGKVIGRGGRIARAIRTVLLIAGSKHHLRVSLDIES